MILGQQLFIAVAALKFPCAKDSEPVKKLQPMKIRIDVNFSYKFIKNYNSSPSA